MSGTERAMRELWEESFRAQISEGAFNTAPVEALVRCVAYWLRDRHPGEQAGHLSFLEVGCGAGPNLLWLAQRGIRVSGVDISPTALRLARETLTRAGCADRIDQLVEASAHRVPLPGSSFDGVLEACVFQHLPRAERGAAFQEIYRLLRPGGLFVGYMLDTGHTVYLRRRDEELPGDPGSLDLQDERSRFYLTGIGLAHFFRREEFDQLMTGFSVVDPCRTTYYLPRAEAQRRGYDEYLQSMWTVYAIK